MSMVVASLKSSFIKFYFNAYVDNMRFKRMYENASRNFINKMNSILITPVINFSFHR